MSGISTPYEAGYDSVVNGANDKNCNFRWFSTPENTAEWERGAKEAKNSVMSQTNTDGPNSI